LDERKSFEGSRGLKAAEPADSGGIAAIRWIAAKDAAARGSPPFASRDPRLACGKFIPKPSFIFTQTFILGEYEGLTFTQTFSAFSAFSQSAH
jgi:hypothetical protein